MASTTTAFPKASRVVLHSLKREDLNGKVGIVQSGDVTNGRQQVFIVSSGKAFALKVENLKHEERALDSLSAKELKSILKSKGIEAETIEKADLVTAVKEVTQDGSPVEIAKAVAQAQAKKTTPTQAAKQLSEMTPDDLRRQAQAMRSMPPDTIRRMNPHLARMTDAQIQMAATQMEMMANNPAAMKAAADQMKGMSQDDMDTMQRGVPTGAATPVDAQTAADRMAHMTPEQMKQQAAMMRTMSPDAMRQMNPQLAHMTDEQLQMAANQMEMMADNPDMMKMAMDQMQNGGGASPNPADAGKMLSQMDPKQLKSMLSSLQNNPEQLKEFAKMSGMSEAQLKQGVDMFAGLDDNKMDAALKMMTKAQSAKETWTKTDEKVGGHLKKIVIAVIVLVLLGVYRGASSYFSGKAARDAAATKLPPKIVEPVVASEFEEEESEF